MFGLPLHPLVVHFPIVLVMLLPIVAGIALWAIGRGASARRAWLAPLAVGLALTVSAFVAVRTGSAQEDRVEHVVPSGSIHVHEEAGERLLVLSGVLVLVAAAGLAGGTVGRASRLLTTVGAVALVAAGVQVGHSGGRLVYRDGAASAYVTGSGASGPGAVDRGEKDAGER
ncbi:MAG: hypothetical protein KGL93_10680 [Gemmatimonadota bacterium]|nr:hypothetical protein [Gemmatimonadota bacterium]